MQLSRFSILLTLALVACGNESPSVLTGTAETKDAPYTTTMSWTVTPAKAGEPTRVVVKANGDGGGVMLLGVRWGDADTGDDTSGTSSCPQIKQPDGTFGPAFPSDVGNALSFTHTYAKAGSYTVTIDAVNRCSHNSVKVEKQIPFEIS